jgi:hypothetical protein
VRQLIESFIDVGSGFVLAILIQLLIFPLFDLHPSILDSIGIALIFTVVSITRSWIWRLVFTKYKKPQSTYQINFDDYCRGDMEEEDEQRKIRN